MALDLGLTTYQLLSALDGLAPDIQSRSRRLDDAIDRALAVPADEAAFRTAAVGRRPYIAARTGPEGLLGSRPPPEVPQDWTALSVDGSHIDVDRHLPLRCHLINLGGCAITYGASYGCQLFNEPTLAVADEDLHLRAPNGASGETLISGPLLGALRTVREVERLADAVENLPDDRPVLALLDGTLAFWDLQRGNYPRYVADVLIAERLQPALARLRAASTDRRPVAVAAYTSRPRTTEVAGAARLMLCEQGDGDCNRLCTARHSDLASCDGTPPASTTASCSSWCWNRATARPCTGPATWRRASPWDWPPARSGATSTISTAAPRSPGSRSPTGWPTIPSCSPSATPCWSSSASWVWAIRWPSPRPTSRPSSPATTGRSSAA